MRDPVLADLFIAASFIFFLMLTQLIPLPAVPCCLCFYSCLTAAVARWVQQICICLQAKHEAEEQTNRELLSSVLWKVTSYKVLEALPCFL